MPTNSTAPTGTYTALVTPFRDGKVDETALTRLIEAQIRAGALLTAGVYIASGKKFWRLSSPAWTWEFNLQTHKWTERQSLNSNGIYGAWRAVLGHPGFNQWLVGDSESGNLLFTDDTNFTENGSPMLYRVESALVKNFPAQVRVARADFDFVVGVGQAVGTISTTVIGAAASPLGGLIRLQVVSTAQMFTGDVASVAGVLGTVEANGNFSINVIDATHIDLQATVFVNAFTSGGIVTDLTTTANQQNPTVAISMSRDGGLHFGNPLQRSLGAQSAVLRNQVFVTRQGYTGTMGARWRLDVTDNVFVSLLGGTMDAELRPPGV